MRAHRVKVRLAHGRHERPSVAQREVELAGCKEDAGGQAAQVPQVGAEVGLVPIREVKDLPVGRGSKTRRYEGASEPWRARELI